MLIVFLSLYSMMSDAITMPTIAPVDSAVVAHSQHATSLQSQGSLVYLMYDLASSSGQLPLSSFGTLSESNLLSLAELPFSPCGSSLGRTESKVK
jgi:hypothetical protein